MSIPATALHLLLSRAANSAYKADLINFVGQTISYHKHDIMGRLSGKLVTGAVLVTDKHPSKSDPIPHFTVDLYGIDKSMLDQPVGTLHLYYDGTYQVFTPPRGLATEAYFTRVANFQAAKQMGSNIVDDEYPS